MEPAKLPHPGPISVTHDVVARLHLAGQAALRNTTSVNVFCVPSVTVCSSGGCESAQPTFPAISNTGAIGARRYMAEADMIETEIKRLLAEEVAAVEVPARSKKLRDRAEECRALAQIVTSAPNAASVSCQRLCFRPPTCPLNACPSRTLGCRD